MFQYSTYNGLYSEAEGLFLDEYDNMDYKRSTASKEALGIRSDNYFFFLSGKL
jgi:hypothetical protein